MAKRLFANLLSVVIGFASITIAFPPADTPHPLFEETMVLWAVIGTVLLILVILGAFNHLIGWGLWFIALGIILFDLRIIAGGIALIIGGIAGSGAHQKYMSESETED